MGGVKDKIYFPLFVEKKRRKGRIFSFLICFLGGRIYFTVNFFFPMRCYFEFRIKLNFEIYLFESNSSSFSFPIGLVGFCGSKEKAFLTFFCSIHFPLSSQAKDESHKHACARKLRRKYFSHFSIPFIFLSHFKRKMSCTRTRTHNVFCLV